MPQADKSAPQETTAPGRSEHEGKEFPTPDREQLEAALRIAFDYRGDVTLDLKEGEPVEGYVHNYDLDRDTISIFVKESKRQSMDDQIQASNVAAIRFTGADLAFGTSWEDWMSKSEKQKKAEAERLKHEAQEKGLL